MEVVVRQASPEDAPTLHANCKSGATLDDVVRQLEWTVRERGPHHLEHFVAVADSEVVGSVLLWPRGAHAVTGEDGSLTLCRGRNGPTLDIARLDDWVVTARLHGQGVGSMLARRVIEEARAWRLRRLESSSANPKAVRSLMRLGFEEWGRFPSDSGGAPESFLIAEL